ncbi:MAG: c-type cytochrome [Verrucomicrobiota bacterium]|nr:c-type cytochrome [Verrucomicrobiota bacterium]
MDHRSGLQKVCLQAVLLLFTILVSKGEVRINPVLAVPSDVPYGERLLGELNCISCHKADPLIESRLQSRKGPRFGNEGWAVTAQFLSNFISAPLTHKPGTVMPDLLHGMSADDRKDTAEALTYFLASLQKPLSAGVSADPFAIQEGGKLFHSIGCVACHGPEELPANLEGTSNSDLVGKVAAASIPLSKMSSKTSVGDLAQFLKNPLHSRPSGRMPSLNLSDSEATAIAMYLCREQAAGIDDPQNREARVEGLAYQYFETEFQDDPDFEKLSPVARGKTDHFNLKARKRQGNFGFAFTGFINVPKTGNYTFYVSSDDGSRLMIGGKLIVDHWGMHAGSEKSGSVELAAGEHPVRLLYYNGGGEFSLQVSWSGPELSKQIIPASALTHTGKPMVPLNPLVLSENPEKLRKGRELFSSLGCASCHDVSDQTIQRFSARDFASLDASSKDSCLSETPRKGLPRYDLSPEQRAALKGSIEAREQLARPVLQKDRIPRTMAALNCYACHTRDGKGGANEERLNYFHVLGETDMGDEGRIPPHLTQVGAKLKPQAIAEILNGTGSVRPYMATRMPNFGVEHTGALPELFDKVDSLGTVLPEPEYSIRESKLGRRLAGSGGLTCISCHTFGDRKSLGIPAVDLTKMAGRLKKEWFHRYLIDPAALRPGTRMPSFWPEGVAVNRDILDGNTDQQINALWVYLSKGREAEPPDGLVTGRKELIVEKEPVIYRNFIAGGGPRAIGVGYPEKANITFDANEMRLAMIWHGAFIDASRHSTGRGEGFEPPLGNNVYQLPKGPSFALLPNPETAWPTETGIKAGYRMGGYRLDEQRRPMFFYKFRDILIEDLIVPTVGEIDPFLVRSLKLKGPATEELYFRAANGSVIEQVAPGKFLVNNKLTVTIRGTGEPLVRKQNNEQELLLKIPFTTGEAAFNIEFLW